MLLQCAMCFSSTFICLLVVTCHGSIVCAYPADAPGYEGGGGGSRFHDTSHISSGAASSKREAESPMNSSHQKQTSENLYPSGHFDVSTQAAETLKEHSAILYRKRRRAERNSEYERNPSHNNSAQQYYALPAPPHAEPHSDSSNQEDHLSEEHSSDEEDKPSHLEDGVPPPDQNRSDLHHVSCIEVGSDHDHHHHDGEGDHPLAHQHQHHAPTMRNISGWTWAYASSAVLIISLCGLFSVAVIPIMQKWFYHTLLQFLVGLAIGSLSGDGLLHLMPHAILDQDTHNHASGETHHHINVSSVEFEMKAIWRGLAALCGIFLFFIAERVLNALTAYRRQKNESKISRHPKNMIPMPREESVNNGSVGEKLAQPKKNSYDHVKENDKETIQMLQTEGSPSKKGSNQSIHEIGFHGRSSFSVEPDMIVSYRPDSDSSVIVSEHHGHGHGHSHEIPQTVSAVAWMVIMGDGLHNFCDGLAIGAAFASGDADGISTTIAVFCHELPHELGDFAMLLKTGMKAKQALFYNLVSSVLCFIGMVIGVSLGNVHSATNWVFAGTAGMFLYIALVDMLPELSTSANSQGLTAMTMLAVQVLGIAIGISTMLLIALYEHELHTLLS